MIKNSLWIGLLALGAQAVSAYSLLGPVAFGDDAWQVTLIGYNPLPNGSAVPYLLDGLLTGPKNLGEEYRRNTRVMYYAANANFLDYFGSNGVAAVDSAYAILNNVFSTNIDSYSAGLTEFPLNSKGLNYQAQGLDLIDLKSVTLKNMATQLGLEDAVRYTWGLHNRYQPTGTTCPASTEYNVVMRNFDITTTPLNFNPPDWGQYSPYVNGDLYTYTIVENCGAALISPPDADAYEVPVDPLFDNPPVASFIDGLNFGEFYNNMTRDDMAGLRYLLSTNTANTETPGGGSLLLVTNLPSPQLITTLPLGPFILQSQTDDPATLLALYPGLIITSTVTNYTSFALTTNITASFTNQPGSAVTNFAPPQVLVTGNLGLLLQEARTNDPADLVALYPGLVVLTVTNYGVPQPVTNVVFAYTNQPGPDVTNLGTEQLLNPPPNSVPPPITSGTLDFGLFSLQALTNTTGQTVNTALAIAQLQALYPGLVILSATPYFTNVITTNFVTSLQIPLKAPLGTPPVQVTSISGYFTNYEARYTYVFGNIMLDSNGTFYPFVDYNTSRSLYGTNQMVTVQTISVTNLAGSPLGNPQSTNTTTTTVRQYGITGDFFIEPTNWCGFTIVPPPLAITPLVSYTTTVTAAGTVNNLGSAQFTQNTIYTYTNHQFLIEPGVCEPVLTNYLVITYPTNVLTYLNTLLNVITITSNANSLVTVVTTNIFTTNGAPAGTLFTNPFPIVPVSYYTNIPSGDFFIEPTNWCGYQILSTNFPTVVISSNTVSAGTSPIFSAPGVVSGETVTYSQTTISQYTNHTLIIQPGVCEPALVFFTNVIGAISTNYQETFANVVTNSYFTNSLVTVVTTNIAPCPGGSAGQLCTNDTSVTVQTNTPSGDFWIEPAAWNCGYTIISVPFTNTVAVTNTIFAAAIPPGVANIGQQYSVTLISEYTNHGLLIQPILCSTQPVVPELYQGIGQLQFVRANYDSELGQFFQPITNVYSMVWVTNSNNHPVVQYFQRVVTVPDFLYSAADFAPGPATGPAIVQTPVAITPIVFDEANVGPGLAGPGVINPPTTFTYDKVGPVYYNQGASFLNGPNYLLLGFIWGSFDASTNAPVIYPNGTSIQNIESQVLLQIASTPSTLPDATNGVAYSGATFSATGGQAPYTWTLSQGSQLPQNLTLSTNGVISGIVTNNAPGVYVFTVQLNDSANRVESLNYFITVH